MAVVATGIDEQLLIGGEWVGAADGQRFDVTDPATGESRRVGCQCRRGGRAARRSTQPPQPSTVGRAGPRSNVGASFASPQS